MKRETDENGFEGGYMACKIAKLEEQFKLRQEKGELKSNLFEGISIFVNGYTRPSPEELKLIMAEHGGVFHTYQRSWTTFVVANNLPDVKIRALGKDKVIRADWIVDCLEAGKIVDYSKYLLYNEKSDQPSLFQFGERKTSEKVESKPGGVNDSQLELLCQTVRMEFENSNDSTDKILVQPKALGNGPKCATDPGFLKEFFKKSRLHHIATLGANFKQYVTELRKKHAGGFPLRAKMMEKVTKSCPDSLEEKKVIMHIDMDCFFVSVGLRNRPHLRGKPVAVTHSMGSEAGNLSHRPGANRELEFEMYRKRFEEKHDVQGSTDNNKVDSKLGKTAAGMKESNSSLAEIASCSYEARKFGIKNGMFVGAALKLCPDLQTIPYDFEAYYEVAQTLYRIIAQYTLDIEAVSCDEMFVDLSELLISTKLDVMSVVSFLRDEIKEATGCPCSAGLGKNKLQARLATKEAKPDGQHWMRNIDEYIKSLPITELPGVGYSTSVKLEKLGLKTCEDLQNLSLPKLHLEFGKKFGETLHQFCRGIDTRPLQLEHVRQTISVDVNYGIRFKTHDEVETFLHQIAEELHDRMSEINHKGKKLTLKILVRAKDAPIETAKYLGTGLCDPVNKTLLLQEATNDKNVIADAIIKLYREMKLPPEELRGIGTSMAKLETSTSEVKVNRIMEMFKNVQPKKIIESPKASTSTMNVTKVTKTPPKRRGRPSMKTQTPQKSTIPNIFQKVTQSKVETKLDDDFLSALPEDIRQEVLRDHQKLIKQEKAQLKSIQEPDSTTVFIENDEISNVSRPEINPDNIFLREDFAIVIGNWISIIEAPTEDDFEAMKFHATELIQHKNLSPLYLALRLLCRKLNSLDCPTWHWYYNGIVEAIQVEMWSKWNRTLAVNALDCPKCEKKR
ncbi:DNA repair protein Rev1 [Culicoides brevitarsis]|uniref:DNA repair protein Rev1 n=1 Tax=Culicoides brevitarsis TaxID=469753 RepID=UPI00307C17A8